MSGLVGAVKTYAYMDRGELLELDIHEGLETTIAVLGHRLKHTSIEVVREYDRDLPKLTVRGSELNQVWTNLIDNAIDALGDDGTITIRPRPRGGRRARRRADDGPGIRTGDPRARLRLVLHHQGGRARHRPRAGDRAPHRRRPPPAARSLRLRAGRDHFHVWLPRTQS